MPNYRYHAISRSGNPVYGSQEAASEDSLRVLLAERGLTLRTANAVSLDASISLPGRRLPRLLQLRLGEQIREALLTDLPAHQAVRAMAAEPFRHPLLMLMPWLFAACVFLAGLSAVWMVLLENAHPSRFALTGLALVIPAIWPLLWYLLDVRPRRFLQRIADRMESGDYRVADLLRLLPGELREVLRSDADNRCRARAVSELVPTIMGSRLHAHRFALSLIGPMLLAAVVLIGLYAVAVFLLPGFSKIFQDFGMELPAVTRIVLGMSRAFAAGGAAGFWTLTAVAVTVLLVSYVVMLNQSTAQVMAGIPVIGVPFRWIMQARVARVLGAMIRHGSPPADAVRTATAASGFASVKAEGARWADRLERGERGRFISGHLNALPLSLLSAERPADDELARERSASVAQNLTSFANMLETASEGHGRLIGLFIQGTVIVIGGFFVGLIIIGLFLPLIQVMNQLA